MPKYLVKFIPSDVPNPNINPKNATVKLGTFHHYRSIEDNIRRDREEGQRGLDLIILKPSRKLDELIANNDIEPDYPDNQIGEDGNFTFEYHIMLHEHLYEFNAWIFCCSLIDDLSEIPKLQKKFKCKEYYFIKDINKFVNAIQSSLAHDLKTNQKTKTGEKRVIYPTGKNIYLDGYKDIVTYSDSASNYISEVCDTLEDFIKMRSKQISKKHWFLKNKKFEDEKEFRAVFYACEKRGGGEIYKTNDDYLILPINLVDCISIEAIPLVE